MQILNNSNLKFNCLKALKKSICIILSSIIAFGTFLTITVGNFMLSDWIDFKSYITANASTVEGVNVYRYDNMVGLYNLDYTDSTAIQYKIGDNGRWTNYVRPFSVEPYKTTKIYKRLGTNGDVTYANITVDTLAMGKYVQADTDFQLTNHGVCFGYTRTYNSKTNSWFESIDSRVYLYSAGLARIYFPDGSLCNLPRTEENKYVDEITGNTLVKDADSGFYIYEDDIYTYKFKITSSQNTYYLNKISDKNGNTITISRASSGITVSDGNSRSFVAPYITAANSADSMHTYTGTDVNSNALTYTVKDSVFYQVDNEDGVTLCEYSYSTDTAGNTRLTQSIDRSIEYYNNGRLKKVTNIDGSYTTYGYSNALNRVRATQSGYGTTYSEYNNAFLPVSYTDEYGDVTTYEYYADYSLKKEITEECTTTYTYSNRKLSTATTVDNEDETEIGKITYTNGLPNMERDEDYYTYYSYDSNGNMLICAELKEDYEGTPPESYDSSLTCFDATSYTYDSKGRVTKEEYSNGESNEYTYDNRGNVLTETVNEYEDEDETQLTSTVTAYTYDNLDNVLTTSTQDSNSSYLYDNQGRLLLSNEDGYYTRNVYDNKGRLVQRIGNEDYDSADDDLENNTYSNPDVGTRYEYNDKDQVTKETNPLGVETTYTYFETGEIQTECFDIYEFEYNIAGSPVDIWVNRENSSAPYAHYVYENDDNQLIPTGNESSTNATADGSTGSVLAEEIVGKNTEIVYGNGQRVLFEYDSDGNLALQKFKASANATPTVQFKYSYDSGRLTQKIDFVNNQIYSYVDDTTSVYTLDYDSENQPITGTLITTSQDTYTEDDEETEDVYEGATTHVNTVGASSVTSVFTTDNDSFTTSNGTYVLTTSYGDDSSSVTLKDSNGATVYSYSYTYSDDETTGLTVNAGNYSRSLTYTYDDKGRITSYGSSADDIEYYHYDSKGQLIRADIRHGENVGDGSTTRYFYDSRGNMTRQKDYSYSTSDELRNNNPHEDYVFDFDYENNVWIDGIETVNGEDQIVYDENGNPVSLSDLTFNWTNGRALSSMVFEDENGEMQTLLSFNYDDNGIRTSKTYGDTTTYYTNNDGYITSQYQLDSNGNICELMEFIYDSSSSLLGFTYGGKTYFYIKNLQGDITNIVDDSGNIVASYEYSAFGDSICTYSAGNDIGYKNPMRYHDYYFDEEMTWYYLQSRYYVPTWGRFLNSDLPEYAQAQKSDHAGLNLFAYCCNDPVNYEDHCGNKRNYRKKYTYVFIYDGKSSLKKQAKYSYYYNYYSNKVIAKYVKTVNDFVKAWNNMNNVDDVFLYLHGGTGKLYFENESIDLEGLDKKLEKKTINGSVFLFSCKGGMGAKNKSVAYELSIKTYYSPVYALMVGVSYSYSAKGYYARVETNYYLSIEYYTYWMCFCAKYKSSKVDIYNLWIKDFK